MSTGSQADIFRPTSVQEVADIVRAAVSDGRRLLTSCRADNAGAAAAESSGRIDLGQMAALVDYPARDMTITVQAGMPYSDLSRVLAEEGQQLPIDVVDSSSTVGALVAENVAGPRQYGYGTLRDYLIGMEAVDGQARVFHAGGRVVKNVAGYDLCRLMIGSRGALGVLTQLTFKLKPIPDYSAGVTFRFHNTDDFETALTQLNTSQATPVVLDFRSAIQRSDHGVINDQPSVNAPTTLSLIVEGKQQTCDWQIERLLQECGNATEHTLIPSSECAADYGLQPDRSWLPSEMRLKIRPSLVAVVVAELSAGGYSTKGHAGNGIVYVTDADDQQCLINVCGDLATRHSGSLSAWSMQTATVEDTLQSGVRTAFDPNGVFVPTTR